MVFRILKASCVGGVAGLLVSCGSVFPSYSVNKRLYAAAVPEQTRIRISYWDQKAWLLDGSGRPVLETDISTGVPGHETPTGEFRVLEKLKDKRSNRYGRYVRPWTGRVVANTWEVDTPPGGTVRRGIRMPYWMRLTWDGVGMHVGKFPKRKRSSFGCIRVHKRAQPMVFRKTVVGTPVVIERRSLQEELQVGRQARW